MAAGLDGIEPVGLGVRSRSRLVNAVFAFLSSNVWPSCDVTSFRYCHLGDNGRVYR